MHPETLAITMRFLMSKSLAREVLEVARAGAAAYSMITPAMMQPDSVAMAR
jgi:hypothetical protein